MVAGIRTTIFWSTPESRIVPLARYVGFEPVFRIEADDKGIVFLCQPDFRPLVKMMQNLDWRQISRIMTTTSRLAGKKMLSG